MKMKLLAAAASAVAFLPAAHAVDLKAGDWTVSIGGNVNAFYTQSSCKQPVGTVAGTALGDAGLACGKKGNNTVIGNGLLPSMLSVGAKTSQGGYDISTNIGIGVAAATGSAIGQNNVVDVRHASVSFGNGEMGTVKLGRDYGLFGLNPVLSDMTLLGVGAATKATQDGRVSLGHLGSGQVYPGTYGQIAYTSPSMGGLAVDVALVDPVDPTPIGLTLTSKASGTAQIQARVSYTAGSTKAWAGVKNQKFTGPDFTMSATELGVSTGAGPFGLTATIQSGKGLGILSDADQGDVKTSNVFLQGTYQATAKTKVGLGWGRSKNDSGTGTDLHTNQNVTTGVYYSLTKNLTLVGELGQTKSKAFSGAAAKQNSVAFGGIFFF